MAKTVYSRLIQTDLEIPGTIVRTSTLPEELGRIEYLLTDKTGTLTRNGKLDGPERVCSNTQKWSSKSCTWERWCSLGNRWTRLPICYRSPLVTNLVSRPALDRLLTDSKATVVHRPFRYSPQSP